MRREKRTAQVKAHIPESLREQLELFCAESNVVSMSDYLFEVLAAHATKRMNESKQKTWRRAQNQ